ncbi:MAG: hypothetical protein ACI8QS_001744 [Planctomycetota bacterium]|jgi:hypothetical protein
MDSLDNVAEFHMSGRRSVFTLNPGAKLNRDAVADAYKDQGLTFESLNSESRPEAKAYYVADAGIT